LDADARSPFFTSTATFVPLITNSCVCTLFKTKLEDYFFYDLMARFPTLCSAETEINCILERFSDRERWYQTILLHDIGMSNFPDVG
jgi:hypothetical protein